jgi:hypothetical protein
MDSAGSAGVVSKAEFARMLNVTPGRVSQYIAEGKLFGPALSGEGRSAQIVVEVARAQLRQRLDRAHRVANGFATRLGDSPAVPTPPSPPGAPVARPAAAPAMQPAPPLSPAYQPGPARAGDVVDEIQREKLRQIRAANRRQEEDELRRRGELAPTAELNQALRKLAGRMAAVMDGALPVMAAQVAAKLQVNRRDVLHELKVEWRKIREAAEAELRAQVAALPATVLMPVDQPGGR